MSQHPGSAHFKTGENWQTPGEAGEKSFQACVAASRVPDNWETNSPRLTSQHPSVGTIRGDTLERINLSRAATARCGEKQSIRRASQRTQLGDKCETTVPDRHRNIQRQDAWEGNVRQQSQQRGDNSPGRAPQHPRVCSSQKWRRLGEK